MNMAAQETVDTPQILATNTLLITNLVDTESFTDSNLQRLQAELEHYGELLRFIPIRNLTRCMGEWVIL
jgi:hypothetical protein